MKSSNIPLLYGVLVAIGLIVYFLILSIFGAHTNPAFSIFNGVILGFGIFAAVSKFRQKKGPKFSVQKGFSAGLTTGFVATILFTAFFAIYATELEPDFLSELITMWETDWFVSIGSVLVLVALGGFASSLVITFAFTQLYKDSWNTKDGQKHTM